MSLARDEVVIRETKKQLAELEKLGWYHSLELPSGQVIQGFQSLERLRNRLAQFSIPDDLRGKRILDIGAWDGWNTFEMERRGAQVVALDAVHLDRFVLARELLHSKAEYVIEDACKMSWRKIGRFNIVLFFGVLYHLKHPVLGLEKVCEVTEDTALIESYVTDDGSDPRATPLMEFYEGAELSGQFDNWVGPNVACLLAMARAAGFAEVKLESVLHNRAHVTCRRKWSGLPGAGVAPAIVNVENTISKDHDFSTERDDYVSIWFKSRASGLGCDNVYAEIGPYAARPVRVISSGADGWHAVCKLSPGLSAGWHDVRLRMLDSGWSNPVRIPVDVPAAERTVAQPSPAAEQLRVVGVTDGKTWEPGRVRVGAGSCLSLWARGIPDGCDWKLLAVLLNGERYPAVFVSETDPEGYKQVNAMLPPDLRPGPAKLSLELAGSASAAVDLDLIE